MSAARQKTPVRIVCPHCRRTYVIKVDLQRIYHTKPRAICSRCGGRFEVVQRMYEIDDGVDSRSSRERDNSTALGSVNHDVGKAPQKRRRARPKGGVIEERGKRRRKPKRASKSTQGAAEEKKPPRPRGADVETELEVSKTSDEPTLPKAQPGTAASSTTTRKFEKKAAKARAATEEPAAKPSLPEIGIEIETRKEKQRPVETAAARAAVVEDSNDEAVASPTPAPLADLILTTETIDANAPVPADLDAPLPWIGKTRTSLGSLTFQLPESAAALEWLLTERPSRPCGASPPPIPVDTPDEADLLVVDVASVDETDGGDKKESVEAKGDIAQKTAGQPSPKTIIDEGEEAIVETTSFGTPPPTESVEQAEPEDIVETRSIEDELENALNHVIEDDSEDDPHNRETPNFGTSETSAETTDDETS